MNIGTNIISDFYGESKANDRQFEHVQDMVETFMIKEMSEHEESDGVSAEVENKEIEVRLNHTLKGKKAPVVKIRTQDGSWMIVQQDSQDESEIINLVEMLEPLREHGHVVATTRDTNILEAHEDVK